MENTTIAAISTALGTAGLSVIRISGENAVGIAEKVFKANKKLCDMQGYTCVFGALYDKEEKIDECVATVFSAPHSYTGENTVELSCHGGLYVTQKTLQAVFAAGAIPAEAGEFTKRAFLNGKLDLTEAEAVMDIINAKSKASARAALSVKEGTLSKKIGEIKALLLDKAAHLNAWADYPEEDIPEVSYEELETALNDAKNRLEQILAAYDNGKILKEGINTVIVGKPNVGKSTLMNLLSGYDKSIVTSVAGTTRDVVEETVSLGDIVLNLSDTAGIRESADEIEKIGVNKAKMKLETASLALCVFDSSQELTAEDKDILNAVTELPAVAIINKTDLPQTLDIDVIREKIQDIVFMSAKEQKGLEELQKTIQKLCLSKDFDTTQALLYNERQRSLTEKAKTAVEEALTALKSGVTYDAVTVAIEEAAAYLAELVGESVTEEVIDRVFHSFCVGK
ncbi:MAG: tRNA uridine-5-carboxymethylaminomethyl(34) synthesis GTPase MnmE [Ruminococcus sp.]|nr:tRNA uridine-5-carboxymethylaminomethyl(34) synthesis GTPase MnmE [Ruminococcus sp.]